MVNECWLNDMEEDMSGDVGEFTKYDFEEVNNEEIQQRLADNFNWLFMSDGAKEEDIHG